MSLSKKSRLDDDHEYIEFDFSQLGDFNYEPLDPYIQKLKGQPDDEETLTKILNFDINDLFNSFQWLELKCALAVSLITFNSNSTKSNELCLLIHFRFIKAFNGQQQMDTITNVLEALINWWGTNLINYEIEVVHEPMELSDFTKYQISCFVAIVESLPLIQVEASSKEYTQLIAVLFLLLGRGQISQPNKMNVPVMKVLHKICVIKLISFFNSLLTPGRCSINFLSMAVQTGLMSTLVFQLLQYINQDKLSDLQFSTSISVEYVLWFKLIQPFLTDPIIANSCYIIKYVQDNLLKDGKIDLWDGDIDLTSEGPKSFPLLIEVVNSNHMYYNLSGATPIFDTQTRFRSFYLDTSHVKFKKSFSLQPENYGSLVTMVFDRWLQAIIVDIEAVDHELVMESIDKFLLVTEYMTMDQNLSIYKLLLQFLLHISHHEVNTTGFNSSVIKYHVLSIYYRSFKIPISSSKSAQTDTNTVIKTGNLFIDFVEYTMKNISSDNEDETIKSGHSLVGMNSTLSRLLSFVNNISQLKDNLSEYALKILSVCLSRALNEQVTRLDSFLSESTIDYTNEIISHILAPVTTSNSSWISERVLIDSMVELITAYTDSVSNIQLEISYVTFLTFYVCQGSFSNILKSEALTHNLYKQDNKLNLAISGLVNILKDLHFKKPSVFMDCIRGVINICASALNQDASSDWAWNNTLSTRSVTSILHALSINGFYEASFTIMRSAWPSLRSYCDTSSVSTVPVISKCFYDDFLTDMNGESWWPIFLEVMYTCLSDIRFRELFITVGRSSNANQSTQINNDEISIESILKYSYFSVIPTLDPTSKFQLPCQLSVEFEEELDQFLNVFMKDRVRVNSVFQEIFTIPEENDVMSYMMLNSLMLSDDVYFKNEKHMSKQDYLNDIKSKFDELKVNLNLTLNQSNFMKCFLYAVCLFSEDVSSYKLQIENIVFDWESFERTLLQQIYYNCDQTSLNVFVVIGISPRMILSILLNNWFFGFWSLHRIKELTMAIIKNTSLTALIDYFNLICTRLKLFKFSITWTELIQCMRQSA